MSYLDIPRIHFGGRFFTDPATVNNDPTHYDPAVINPSPWQRPNGQHRFEFRDCLIKSAVGSAGFVGDDPIIGAAITSVITQDKPIQRPPNGTPPSSSASPAKLVDIDVYQQGVTAIYGLQLTITVGLVSITGIVDTPTLNQYWLNCVLPTRSWEDSDYNQDSFGGDMNACGIFQSVIRIDAAAWPQSSSSILNTLQQSTLQVDNQYLVAIKFVLDGYRNVPQDNQFLTGRIVGTLGTVLQNEPLYNPGQRWLLPRIFTKGDPWYSPSFNDCPFKVDVPRKKLVIDLANSICRQTAGGSPVDLGTLQAVVTTGPPVITVLGEVDYSDFAYENNAHITELDLNDAQLIFLQEGKLKLVSSRQDIGNDPAVLSEPSTNVSCAVEVRNICMEGDPNGTPATTRVYVSQNGQPLANKQLSILIEGLHGGMPGVSAGPNDKGNTEQGEGALAATITSSDEYGFATVTLSVLKDPGSRTTELDGQVYFVIVFDPDYPHPDWKDPNSPMPPQNQTITCKIFSQYPVNENPTWEIIRDMMAPYMKLYPGMKEMVDLTDLHTFTVFSNNPPWVLYGVPPTSSGPLGIKAGAIPYYMSRDLTDPRFMPISRDLSKNKTLTLMHFVKSLQTQAPVETKPTT